MTWTFITNHAAVLSKIAKHDQVTMRELAIELGLTERSIARIICDLESEGYIEKHLAGRTNWYRIHPGLPMRRTELRHIAVGEILQVLTGASESTAV